MDWQEWFENAWARREETLYREFFGADTGCIYPLDHDILRAVQQG